MRGVQVCGFNPCSNGLSAQRTELPFLNGGTKVVSILVLMDFRLKGYDVDFPLEQLGGFNPCSNGLSAQRGYPATGQNTDL